MPLCLLSIAALCAPQASRFAPPENVTSGVEGATDAALFDIDADGDDDVIVAAAARLVVFERSGPGTFDAPYDLASAGLTPGRLLLGDLSGDGLRDLVSFDFELGELRVFTATSGSGLGDGRPILTVGPDATAIDLADANGDGTVDVLISFASGGIQAYPNLGGLQLDTPTPVGPPSIVVLDFEAGDLDGDGDIDVMFGAGVADRVGWLPGNGNGTFANERFVANALEDPRDVDLVDMDGDGDLDAVVAWELEGRVDWYENIAAGLYFGRGPLATDLDRPVGLDASDLDADGDVDVVVYSAGSESLAWIEADGSMTFLPPAVVLAGVEESALLLAVDADDDAQVDLLTSTFEGELLLCANEGPGAMPRFAAPAEVTRLALAPSALQAADIDADGVTDLVFAEAGADRISWIDGLGDGSYGVRRTIDSEASSISILRVADFDQNGAVDLVTANEATEEIYVTLASAPGSFVQAESLDFLPSAPTALEVGDLDGDGRLDIVVATESDETLWYENLGGGVFAPSQMITTPQGEAVGLELADIDADGALDVALVLTSPDQLAWFRNQGNGTFAPAQTIGGMVPGIVDAAIVDLNGDDDLDAVWLLGVAGEAYGALNFGGGFFGSPTLLGPIGTAAYALRAADLDGDGDVDLAVTVEPSIGSSGIVTAENDGTASFGGFEEGPVELQSVDGVALNDVDADGDLDAFAIRMTSGRIAALENQVINFIGERYCSPAVPNATGLDGRISALGSEAVADNDVMLRADRLPPGVFGFFFTSTTPSAPISIAGGQGLLCITGSIGRYVGAGQILIANSVGRVELDIDLTMVPQPTGPVMATAGETWNFQLWHRDSVAGVATSNFTDALGVAFE